MAHSLQSYEITNYKMEFKFSRKAVNLVNITLTIPYVGSLQSQQKISSNLFKKELDTYRDYT